MVTDGMPFIPYGSDTVVFSRRMIDLFGFRYFFDRLLSFTAVVECLFIRSIFSGGKIK